MEKNKTILEEANEIIYGERENDYGSVTDNFNKIAQLWSAVLGVEISAKDVGLCMIQLKIARELNQHKRDNLVDLAGYAGTLEKLEKGL